MLEGEDPSAQKEKEISADVFFQIEIKVHDREVVIQDKKLTADGKALTTEKTVNGGVA